MYCLQDTNFHQKKINMQDKIKIDLVSDVVCPWCIIGYKRLVAAITQMGIQDQVEIEWQPFELNSSMPPEGENVDDHITRKYGTSKADGQRSKANLTKLGAELGFTFDYFDEMKIVNTRAAHILLDYAHEEGKQTALNLRLMEAFFSERSDISLQEVLLAEIQKVGLDQNKAKRLLTDKAALEAIKTKEKNWTSKGISSVPTMVFNNTSALSGAQSIEVYKRVLAELIHQNK